MNLKDQLDTLLDATAFDTTGAKLGAVRQVYVDDASGKITFATVSTGIFSADAIVPLHGARLLDDELHVAHPRNAIRNSPRPDHTEDGLTPDQELRLLEHYGLDVPGSERGQTDTPAAMPSTAAGAADATPSTPAEQPETTPSTTAGAAGAATIGGDDQRPDSTSPDDKGSDTNGSPDQNPAGQGSDAESQDDGKRPPAPENTAPEDAASPAVSGDLPKRPEPAADS